MGVDASVGARIALDGTNSKSTGVGKELLSFGVVEKVHWCTLVLKEV